MPKTVYKLYDYQARFLRDRSRFKIGLWSRQTGKSFTAALEATDEAIAHADSLWIVLSAGERQSLEFMQKVRMHARVYGEVARLDDVELDAHTRRLSVTFGNGSRIIGLPANPNTARGYSGNVILDEFAFHEDSRAIWRGLVPTITRGYRLIVLSTPNGRNNMFYELWAHHDEFSHHKVTIPDAKAAGLNVDVDALRRALDPDGWQQEYLCEFLDEASALITYEMLDRAEMDAGAVPPGTGPLHLGMDVGRKRDLSVIWLLERVGDVYWTHGVRTLDRTPFHDQLEVLSEYLRNPRVRRACIDSTGLGAMLAEEAQRLHGRYRVEAVNFTAAVKEDLAMRLLRAFQDRALRIPPDREIREDIHKVRKVVTVAGNIRFEAERDDAGHADRFWALALALHAGSAPAAAAIGARPFSPRELGFVNLDPTGAAV